MITHPNSDDDTITVLKQWTSKIDPSTIPVSILSNPTTMTRNDVIQLKDLGADIFTVAIDAATPARLAAAGIGGDAVGAQPAAAA